MADKKKEKYEESHLYRIRHSCAHVMAGAVLEEFPTGKVAIGPAIEDGFTPRTRRIQDDATSSANLVWAPRNHRLRIPADGLVPRICWPGRHL